MIQFFKNQISKCLEEKMWFFTAIFYAILIVSNRILHFNFEITDFAERSFSQATASNYDISARVWLYFSSVLLFLFLSFSFKYLLSFGQKIIHKNIAEIINYASIIGVFFILFQTLGFEIQNSLFFIFYIHILLAISGVLLQILKHKNEDFLSANWIISSIIFSISLSIPIIQFINFDNSYNIYFFIVFAVLFLIFNALWFYFSKTYNFSEKQIIKFFSPIAFLPILYVFSVEFYLILNNREIFSISPTIIYSIVFVAILAFVWFNFIRLKQNPKTNFKLTFSNFVIPTFIAGIVAMVYYEPISLINQEMFEQANPVLAVQQYFEFEKIPFIDNFNSHALSEIFFKFIFSFVNGYDGMVYAQYDFLEKVLYAVIVYFILRNILNNSLISLSLVLLLPFLETLFPLYFNITLFSVLTLIFAFKKQNFTSYLLFIISIVFLVAWRIDIGFAVLIATIYSVFVLIIIDKNILKTWRKFLLALAIVFGIIALKFLMIYIFTQGDVINSLSYILNYLSSAQSYGIVALTNNAKDLNFYLHFAVFPATALILLILGFVTFKKNSEQKFNYKYFFLAFNFLIVFYLLNFQRGIIRHSFIEQWDTALSSYIFVIFAISFLLFFNDLNNLKKSIIFTVLASLLLFSFKYPENDIFNKNYIERFIEKTQKIPFIIPKDSKIERILKDEIFEKNTFSDFKQFLDENIKETETFADFSNSPMLYFYTNRENPNFFNQSLLTCHNDKLQDLYISEIKKSNVPVLVFSNFPRNWWDATDGISNTLRFYKISQFLYQNYKPFAIINDKTIWLKNNHSLLNSIDTISKIYNSEIVEIDGKSEIKIDSISLKNFENSIFVFINCKIKNSANLSFLLKDNSSMNIEPMDTISAVNHYIIDAKTFAKISKIVIAEKAENISEITIIQSKYLPDFYSKLYTKSEYLGYIPYVFGRFDSKYTNKQFSELYSFSTSGFELKSNEIKQFETKNISKFSNYILVRAKCNESSDSQLILKFGTSEFNISGAFNFVVKNVDFHDYILPISTNFNWTNENIKYVFLQSKNGNFEVEKISLIKE